MPPTRQEDELQAFLDNPIHAVLAECGKLRPPVDIAVLD